MHWYLILLFKRLQSNVLSLESYSILDFLCPNLLVGEIFVPRYLTEYEYERI